MLFERLNPRSGVSVWALACVTVAACTGTITGGGKAAPSDDATDGGQGGHGGTGGSTMTANACALPARR